MTTNTGIDFEIDFNPTWQFGVDALRRYAYTSDLMQASEEELDNARVIVDWMKDNQEKIMGAMQLNAFKRDVAGTPEVYDYTIDLMRKVAEHLAGVPIDLKIQEPEAIDGARGECWYERTGTQPAVKIAISPAIMPYPFAILKTLLHEVAHAKLHMTADGVKFESFNGQFEKEAKALSERWERYAEADHNNFGFTGAPNKQTHELWQNMAALLNNPGIANWWVSLEPGNEGHA